MTPPPNPFKLVYRDFIKYDWDEEKNETLWRERYFDFEYITNMFPSFVLEREDTRGYNDQRYQIIGEIEGEVFFVIYTMRETTCRIITAWRADKSEKEFYYDHTR